MTVLNHAANPGKHALSARKNDLYETPDVAVHALLRVEELPHVIWEPACGPGAIVQVLRAAGHEVIATDLVDYGCPDSTSRRDFLMEWHSMWALPYQCEAIVTNPPFKLAEQFVAHALDLCPRVVMLLPLTFLEAKRSVLDRGQLARVHVFKRRLPMMHRRAKSIECKGLRVVRIRPESKRAGDHRSDLLEGRCAMTADLFAPPGPLVRLDRNCDRLGPCCQNLATVHPRPRGMHAAELRCTECGRFRGWLPKIAMTFIAETTKQFGVPTEPIVLRDSSIGDHHMQKQRDNSGILFKNNRKEAENHPDYTGTINVGGAEFFINGWIKQGPKAKFMSLSVKPKDGNKPAASDKSLADEMNDANPF